MPDRSRSLSVSAGIGSTTSGTLTPLWSDSGPPTTTSVSSPSARLRTTRSRSLPSSSSSEQPILAASMIDGCGRFTREALPGVGLRSSRNGWPVCRNTRPPEKLPTRSFRSLHVGENADRALEAILELADQCEARGVILVRAVAEIEPEHIGAGLEQARQHLGRRAGRAKRGDDLGAPPAAQLWSGGHLVSLRRSGWRGHR